MKSKYCNMSGEFVICWRGENISGAVFFLCRGRQLPKHNFIEPSGISVAYSDLLYLSDLLIFFDVLY